jgi:ComF family protein
LTGEEILGKSYFDRAVSIFKYDFRVRELIHDFKYRGIKEIGRYFSEIAVKVLQSEYNDFTKVDFVVSVPMSRVRKRERTFNQAECLSKYISKALNLNDYSSFIVKTRQTDKQALKDFDTRVAKTNDLYKIKDKQLFEGKTVLVIDDVFTTGATVNELSKTLKNTGVKKVYVFTIASGKVRKNMSVVMKKQIRDYSRKELARL